MYFKQEGAVPSKKELRWYLASLPVTSASRERGGDRTSLGIMQAWSWCQHLFLQTRKEEVCPGLLSDAKEMLARGRSFPFGDWSLPLLCAPSPL